ncbi:YceI family protein [Staphylococcus haemolyticus]|uniref:YceI family protein n=1 Tax=Staphylococcus haemolyticus TaxID=1283 RepID=UPI0015D931DD|nr:YceI family protein [Staphylococcus haemolyticus]
MANLNLDPAHSGVNFSIQHLVVSNVKGRFNEFDANISGDFNDLSSLQGTFTVQANSIDTKVADRDNHLKSTDFLDVENYPEIKFEITKVDDKSVTGNLTMKDQTHEETFDLDYKGTSLNPLNGKNTAGLVITGSLNREKYGITFNQQLETGGFLLGKDLNVEFDLEFPLED